MPATSYYSSYYGGTVAAPVTTYYAPYTSYYSPAVMGSTIYGTPYVPGQPVRNAFRSLFYQRSSRLFDQGSGLLGVGHAGRQSRMRMLRM